MLTVHSKVFSGQGQICLDDVSDLLSKSSVESVAKLKELILFGESFFGQGKHIFYECFHLTEALQLEECHTACCRAAGSFGAAVVKVMLEEEEERALSCTLQRMFAPYPALPSSSNFFDMYFMHSVDDTENPCARAHSVVLVSVSDYFRALRSRSMSIVLSENTINNVANNEYTQQWCVTTADVHPDVVQALLQFTYTGQTKVARRHFREFAFQADGWQMKEIVAACAVTLSHNELLAAEMLHAGSRMAEDFQVAVAYGLPEVVGADDVQTFVTFISNPLIAQHLCLATHHKHPNIAEFLDKVGGRGSLEHRHAKGKGEGACIKLAYGEASIPNYFGSQLERFIKGPYFRNFLAHPEALHLPKFSVVMIVESFFIQLTTSHPEHPSHSKGPHRNGTTPPGRGFLPDDWSANSKHVQMWLIRWAELQAPAEVVPCLAGLRIPSVLQHLVSLKSSVYHKVRAYEGDLSWKPFWREAFEIALSQCTDDIIDVLRHAEQYLQCTFIVEKGNGKGGTMPQKEFALLRCADIIFEVALARAAANSLQHLQDTAWSSLSAPTIIQILSSKSMPEDVHVRKTIMKKWLFQGCESPVLAHVVVRALDLSIHLSRLDQVLRHPIRSNRAPRLFPGMQPLEDAGLILEATLKDVIQDVITQKAARVDGNLSYASTSPL
jgi:hypothetical protein